MVQKWTPFLTVFSKRGQKTTPFFDPFLTGPGPEPLRVTFKMASLRQKGVKKGVKKGVQKWKKTPFLGHFEACFWTPFLTPFGGLPT